MAARLEKGGVHEGSRPGITGLPQRYGADADERWRSAVRHQHPVLWLELSDRVLLDRFVVEVLHQWSAGHLLHRRRQLLLSVVTRSPDGEALLLPVRFMDLTMITFVNDPHPILEPDAWLPPGELRTLVPPQNAAKLESLIASMLAGGWTGRPILAVGDTAWTGPHRIAAAARTHVRVPVVRIDPQRAYAIEERVAANGGPRLASILDISDRIRFFQVAARLTGDCDFARAAALLQLEERAEWLTDHAMSGLTPSSLPETSSLVYAIGRIGFDFGPPARLDDFRRRAGADVRDAERLLAHLQEHPADAAEVIWTLELDGLPLYAIEPASPFAEQTYAQLRGLLASQAIAGVGGRLEGMACLSRKRDIPRIVPARRGIHVAKDESIATHMQRLARNRGRNASERAINFVAAYAAPVPADGRVPHEVQAARSPLCRPDSECIDVRLTLFDPANRLTRAHRIVVVSVDVRDEVPVVLGQIKQWEVFA